MIKELIKPEEITELNKVVPLNQRPIWQYWPEFVEKYLRTGKSEVTVKGVRDGLQFAIRQLKVHTIEQLNTPRSVEDTLFKYKADHGIKNNTFNSYRKNFNTFCIWLEKMEYIAENNIGKMDKCKAEYEEHLTLTKEQVNSVIVQIRERKQTKLERVRNIFFIDLLRFTGARPCELEGLKVRDITKTGNNYTLCVQGRKQKGRKRYYKLSTYVIDSFEAYMAHRNQYRPNEEYLFVSCYKRMAWTYVGMKNLFAAISKELGFHVNQYAFRRYVATRLNNDGAPLKEIQNYLGHTRSATTERYIERSCVLTNYCSNILSS